MVTFIKPGLIIHPNSDWPICKKPEAKLVRDEIISPAIPWAISPGQLAGFHQSAEAGRGKKTAPTTKRSEKRIIEVFLIFLLIVFTILLFNYNAIMKIIQQAFSNVSKIPQTYAGVLHNASLGICY
jgi:hypothetical protein